MNKREKEAYAKETELKDNWRYSLIGRNDWVLDKNPVSPEDDIIKVLDGDFEEDGKKSGIEMIEKLSDIQKQVVFFYIWEGYSFQKIGKILNFTKQRIHQIYWEAIKSLKE